MYTHQGDKVVGLTVAYIGGGSRGWAWGFMRDIISDGQISGTVRLYDIDREAAERNQKIGTMLAAHPDGLFCFPAKSPVQSGTVYWDDLLLDTNDYMVFTVDKTMARTGGNAVIGYLDPATGLVKWSWHIWVTDREVTLTAANGYEWMDRNLGALNNTPGAVANRGLFYQWGRKDPFLPSSAPYTTGNVTEANVENHQVGDGTAEWAYTGVRQQLLTEAPGNIENAVAAVAALWCASERDGEPLDAERLREALASFEGVKRRFEFYVNTPRQVYMDDYAHHPRELAAAITSVKKMFPGRRLTALFQPHLYTRTRDFYREFAEALSHADRVVLLPIYPAREEPIPGVESEMIGRLLTVPWTICDRAELAEKVAAMDTDVVVSFGAGNIDGCGALAEKLREKA